MSSINSNYCSVSSTTLALIRYRCNGLPLSNGKLLLLLPAPTQQFYKIYSTQNEFALQSNSTSGYSFFLLTQASCNQSTAEEQASAVTEVENRVHWVLPSAGIVAQRQNPPGIVE